MPPAAAGPRQVRALTDRVLRVLRVLLPALVVVAVVLRAVLAPGWASGFGVVRIAATTLGGLLLVGGTWWLWRVSRPPYDWRPGSHGRFVAETQARDRVTAAARQLLADLAAGVPVHDAWAAFEETTGMTVSPTVRSVLDPDMPPDALAGYLVSRQPVGRPLRPDPLTAVLVPTVVCLLPALALLLL